MTLVVRMPRSADSERSYVVGLVLGDWLGLEYELALEERGDVSITLPGEAGELLLADVFLPGAQVAWLLPESLPPEPLRVWAVDRMLRGSRLVDARLPVIAGSERADGTYARVDSGTVELGLDIFGSVFFMVSRYEEAVPGPRARDKHDRFAAGASLAVRQGFVDRPLANEYIEVLWAAISRLWPTLERRKRRYRFLPSHDVDVAFCRETSTARLVRRLGADVVRRRDLGLARRRVQAYWGPTKSGLPRDLCDTYDELMNLSEAAGTRSVFFFFGERTGLSVDADYDPAEPRIRRVLRRIGERGHEIGLHPSYRSQRDQAMIRRQLDGLRAACALAGVEQEDWGSRQHYLRWDAAATWRALEAAGVAYDSTVGYSSIGGFRAGCCYEFPVYDLQSRRKLSLRERPLVVMEVALLDRQRLSHHQVVERVAELQERCRIFDGDFMLNWHNSRLQTRADAETYAAIVRVAA